MAVLADKELFLGGLSQKMHDGCTLPGQDVFATTSISQDDCEFFADALESRKTKLTVCASSANKHAKGAITSTGGRFSFAMPRSARRGPSCASHSRLEEASIPPLRTTRR